VLEQAIALEGPADGPDSSVPGPDLVLRLAALLHDIGKPATGASMTAVPAVASAFHHHEMVGAKLTTRRMKAMRFDKDTIKAVSRLVELHLRFHGYGGGSGPTRPCAAMSPTPGRCCPAAPPDPLGLHDPQRAQGAASLAPMTTLETRIARLMEQEQLDAVRPELDGNEIAEVLGITPGPVLGRAYKHLLEVRMDRGPHRPRRGRGYYGVVGGSARVTSGRVAYVARSAISPALWAPTGRIQEAQRVPALNRCEGALAAEVPA
jgi:poly(A) polymerase